MDLNLGLTVMSLVSFIILMWVFNRYFFSPILNNVHMREHTIEKQIKDAENALINAGLDRETAAKLLQKTRDEATEIMDKARELAENTKKDIINKATLESAELYQKAEAKIEQQSRKVFEELRSEVASIALMTAEKILTRSITDADQQRLVDEVIREKGSAHVI